MGVGLNYEQRLTIFRRPVLFLRLRRLFLTKEGKNCSSHVYMWHILKKPAGLTLL